MGSLPYNLDPNKGPVGQYCQWITLMKIISWHSVFRVQDVPLQLPVRRLPCPASRHGHLMVMFLSILALGAAWTTCISGSESACPQSPVVIMREISKFPLQWRLLKYSTSFVMTIWRSPGQFLKQIVQCATDLYLMSNWDNGTTESNNLTRSILQLIFLGKFQRSKL